MRDGSANIRAISIWTIVPHKLESVEEDDGDQMVRQEQQQERDEEEEEERRRGGAEEPSLLNLGSPS